MKNTKFRIASLINLNSFRSVESKLFRGKSLTTRFLVFILFFICTFNLNAANRYAVASSGNWNSTTTWSSTSGGLAGASIPIAGDVVYIGERNRDRTVTIPSGYTANCASINIGNLADNNNVTLIFSSATSSLNVSNNVVMNRPNGSAIGEIRLWAGNMTVNGNLTISYNTASSTANNQINGITITTGTLTVGGDLVYAGQNAYQNQIIFGGSGILNVGGNFTLTNNVGFFTASTGTVNYNGTNQSIAAVTYNNVNFTNSGTKTASGAITATKNVTIQSGCTLNGADFTHFIGGNWSNSGTYTSTGTVTFNGTSAQNISSSDFNNITFTGTGSKTATGSLTIAGNVDIQSQTTFVAGSYTHYVAGNWTKSGTFTSAGSTIEFNSATNASIGSSNFNNIVLSGSGTKTATGTLSIVGNVNISNNFSAGNFSHNLQGNWINNGSFTANTSTINLIAANPQTIGGSNSTTFYQLTQNGTGLVTLNIATQVSGTLALILGNIDIAAYHLTVGAITGGNANSYIETSGVGRLVQSIDYNITKTFPVGKSAYNPATIKNNSVGGIDNFFVGVSDDQITNANANTKTIKHKWYIYKANAGYANLTLSLTYNSGEEESAFNAGTNPTIGFFSGSYWGYGAATVSGNTFTSTSPVQNANQADQFLCIGSGDAFTASKLAITSIEPNNPNVGVANSTINVETQNSLGVPTHVYTNTSYTLSATNTAFSGTNTGTILAYTSNTSNPSLTFTTSTFDAILGYLHNATVTATRTSGEILSAGTSGVFDVYDEKIYEPKATGNWSSNSNWRYSTNGGSTWRDTTAITTFTNNEIIRIPVGITLTADVTSSFYSMIVLGTVDITTDGNLTINQSSGSDYNIYVNGTLRNSGGVLTNDNGSYPTELIDIHGGIYEHARDGGSIPVAHWSSLNSTKSTCVVNGTNVSGLNQVFENFTLTTGEHTLTADMTVNGIFTLTNGKITTGNNYRVIIGLTGTTSVSNGYINGNLRRYIVNNTDPIINFPIGDATNNTPVSIKFVGTATGNGYLDASTTSGQPTLASGLSQTKYVNRKWTITFNGEGGFSSYEPTFTFAAGNIVGGADYTKFGISYYDGSYWSIAPIGDRTSTSTKAVGLTHFTDFYVGESDCSSTNAIWLGGTSSDWNTASNWCNAAVPTSTADVVIPNDIATYPVISSAAICKDIDISNGASLTFSGAYTLDLKGNWTNNGTIVANTGTVSFTGLTAQTITGATDFNNLTINNSTGVTAANDIIVNGNLTLTSSNPNATQGALDMGTNTLLFQRATSTVNGVGDVTGIVKRIHTFDQNIDYQLSNQHTSINFVGTGGSKPTEISCKTSIGTAPTWRNVAVNRIYTFSQVGGTDQVNIKLHYLDSELHGAETDQSKLVLWDAHDGSANWNTINHPHGKSDYNATENWVGLTGLTIDYIAKSSLDNLQFGLSYTTYTKNTWTGAINSNWNTSGNWSGGNVPLTTDEVLIPDVTTEPILSSDIEIKSLEIASGSSLTTNNYNISINGYNGAWANSGTFYPGTGTVRFIHDGLTDIVTISGNTQFHNIYFGATTFVQPGAGTYTKVSGIATGELSSIIDLSVNESTVEYNGDDMQYIINPETEGLDFSGYHNLVFSGDGVKVLYGDKLNISGDFSNSSTFEVSTGTVSFIGNSVQNISGTTIPVLSNLTINNVAGVTSNVGIVVNGELNLLSDNPTSLNKGTLDIIADTLKLGADATVTGIGDVSGIVKRTHTFNENQYYAFSSTNTGVTFETIPGQTIPTSITLQTNIGTAPDWTGTLLNPKSTGSAYPNNPVRRIYKIAQTAGSGTSGLFRVHYKDNEIPSNVDESSLTLWDRVKVGANFYGMEDGKSNHDVVQNFITLQDVDFSVIPSILDNFGAGVAASETPYHKWIGVYNTDWNNSSNWNPSGVPTATDAVIIPSTHVTVYAPSLPATATCKTLVVQADGVLNTVDGATLTLAGSGSAWNIDLGGTFNAGNSTLIFNANATTVGDISINGRTNLYNLTISSNALLRPGANSHIGIAGALTISGTLAASTNSNTFEYNGTNQSIANPNGGSPGYHDLIISGSGTKTLPATLNIAGDFTNNGTVDANGGTVIIKDAGHDQTINGTSETTFNNLTIDNTDQEVYATTNINVNGALVINNNTTLDMGTVNLGGTISSISGTGTLKTQSTSTTPLPSGKTWTMPVIYNGTAQQNIVEGTYASLQNSNTITVVRALGTLNTTALILDSETTLDMGTNQLSSMTTNSGTGTLKTQSTSSTSLPSEKTWAGTVIYNGTEAQTAPAGTYNNLTIDNAAEVTLGQATITTLLVSADSKLTTSGISSATNATLECDENTNEPGTIVDNGTLTTINSTVKQYIAGGRNWYVSSPVAGVTKTSIVNNQGYSFWSYDEPTAAWVSTDTSFGIGKGYILNKTAAGTLNFTGGTLNSAEVIVNLDRHKSVTKAGFNLVGNPYPSYLDWTLATKDKIMSTIWYRTKNISGTYVFDTYNGVGTNNNELGSVSGMIAPMQAFWVRVDSTGSGQNAVCSGSFTLNNSMRSHEPAASGNNDRLKAPEAIKVKQQVLRMQVSNGVNSDEAIVLFNPNASNGYDSYDSPKMTNANVAVPEIYTKVGNENLVINGLNSIATNPSIPLGFTTGATNTFTIKASEVNNFDVNTRIILVDNELNTEQDLTNGSAYSFTSDKITTIDRFKIVFKTAGTVTGLNPTDDAKNSFVLYKNNNGEIIVNIEGNVNNQASVSIYNAIGQKLLTKQCTGATTVLNPKLTTGVYYVSVSDEGSTMTRKIVFN